MYLFNSDRHVLCLRYDGFTNTFAVGGIDGPFGIQNFTGAIYEIVGADRSATAVATTSLRFGPQAATLCASGLCQELDGNGILPGGNYYLAIAGDAGGAGWLRRQLVGCSIAGNSVARSRLAVRQRARWRRAHVASSQEKAVSATGCLSTTRRGEWHRVGHSLRLTQCTPTTPKSMSHSSCSPAWRPQSPASWFLSWCEPCRTSSISAKCSGANRTRRRPNGVHRTMVITDQSHEAPRSARSPRGRCKARSISTAPR